MRLLSATGLATMAIAGSLFLASNSASAQSACATALDNPRPAFTATGIELGELVAEVRNSDGDAEAFVIAEEGIMYGYLGGRRILPSDFVEMAAAAPRFWSAPRKISRASPPTAADPRALPHRLRAL
ncbi:MAG: hypothetical protein ACMVY4_10410 [Minwuia sp.]|uniref:hypothetical protein n=1 Tax=Minwuia sp. TaxID=2493630 RepID=UPI003A839BE8